MATQKNISLARQIKEDLGLLGFTVVDTFDSSGWPCLAVGTVTAGSQGCSLRVRNVTTPGVDSLGLNANVFCPQLIQWCVEANASTPETHFSATNMAKVLPQLAKHGVRIDMCLLAHTTDPTIANMDTFLASNPPTWSIDNLWHPLTSSM